jgi:hypothetical protein
MVFLTKMDGYQKLCDTNKNMTKTGVIIKGVYYTLYQNQGGYTISNLNFEAKHLWRNKC